MIPLPASEVRRAIVVGSSGSGQVGGGIPGDS